MAFVLPLGIVAPVIPAHNPFGLHLDHCSIWLLDHLTDQRSTSSASSYRDAIRFNHESRFSFTISAVPKTDTAT